MYYTNVVNDHDAIIESDKSDINCNLDSPEDRTRYSTTNRVDESLDITNRTLAGPIASSPRRVTISDSIERHIYDLSDPIHEEQPTEVDFDRTTTAQEAASEPTPEQVPILYNNDDTRKDPAYVPSESDLIDMSDDQRAALGYNGSNVSTNLSPRYPLRSLVGKRKQTTDSTTKRYKSILKTSKATALTNDDSKTTQDDFNEKISLLIDLSDDVREDLILF